MYTHNILYISGVRVGPGRVITQGAGNKGSPHGYLFINSLNLAKIVMLVTLKWITFNFDFLKLQLFYFKTYYCLFTKEKKSYEIMMETNYFLYLFTCYKIHHIKKSVIKLVPSMTL